MSDHIHLPKYQYNDPLYILHLTVLLVNRKSTIAERLERLVSISYQWHS